MKFKVGDVVMFHHWDYEDIEITGKVYSINEKDKDMTIVFKKAEYPFGNTDNLTLGLADCWTKDTNLRHANKLEKILT